MPQGSGPKQSTNRTSKFPESLRSSSRDAVKFVQNMHSWDPVEREEERLNCMLDIFYYDPTDAQKPAGSVAYCMTTRYLKLIPKLWETVWKQRMIFLARTNANSEYYTHIEVDPGEVITLLKIITILVEEYISHHHRHK
ncbi:hypothetical protein PHLCEN_2v13427 [Hermanssonia centrifuga]|uniref:Uncharacterized protein n=1 Tax=Hermanssonia centrifuga TaxID=98765 RepID=A0A2R6NE90_9APHY|nr:hypothetical protein PHLCEN_2v13427 [Hermanssonia centrifuga]